MSLTNNSYFQAHSRIRIIASIVLVTFSSMILRPTITFAADSIGQKVIGKKDFIPVNAFELALKKKILSSSENSVLNATSRKKRTSEKTDDEVMASQLKEVKKKLKSLIRKKDQKSDLVSSKREISSLEDLIKAADADVDRYNDSLSDHIKTNKLSDEVKKTHEHWVVQYKQKMRNLLSILDHAVIVDDPDEMSNAIDKALVILSSGKEKRDHQPFNPALMPFKKNEKNTRKPLQTDIEYNRLFKGDASIGSSTPVIPSAATSGSGIFTALAPPAADDLVGNEDVQITPEIVAKATELSNDPVTIFNWVRNNISFMPTYGSMQGSRLTLEMRRGNAFDISSLLIALFRASGVPARYVMGTVQIPIDQAMNWVDNVENSDVLQDMIGQGGIPNVAITESGVVTKIEVEHVWVEAWVDNIPSRGAVNVEGDTWVPMDASFKQYSYTAASTLLSDLPYDMAGLNTTILASATVDSALGKISGISEGTVRASLESYAESVQQYNDSHGLPSNMETIVGSKTVINKLNQQFIGGLPYKIIAKSPAIATLPNSHRFYVTLNGYNSSFDKALGSTSFSTRVSLPALNSNRLGISYDPATPSDAATWQSFIDSGAVSLPLNLINVKAVVKLDDAILTEGPSIGMGNDQFVDVVIEGATGATTVPYQVIAGDEIVFGITGNGFTSDVLEARMNRVTSDTAAENLHQAALHYWYESDSSNQAAASGYQVHTQLLPSVGLFSSPLNVSYLFGFPNSGAYQSRFMDVKRVLIGVAGVSQTNSTEFMKQAGIQGSFLEGSVFDQLFDRPQGNGISAIQLIADSNALDIPIYTIDATNISAVLPLLSVSADVKNDISTAISAGKIAIVPESELVRGDWSGTGYILRDESTGEGAYLISGGLNGGSLLECLKELVPLALLIAFIILLAFLAWWSLPALGAGALATVRALAVLFAMFAATGTAYAGRSQTRSKQADPCNCPPVTKEWCEEDTSHTHFPCTGIHWHVNVYNQGPAPACIEYGPYRNFGGCGPMPSPCPP